MTVEKQMYPNWRILIFPFSMVKLQTFKCIAIALKDENGQEFFFFHPTKLTYFWVQIGKVALRMTEDWETGKFIEDLEYVKGKKSAPVSQISISDIIACYPDCEKSISGEPYDPNKPKKKKGRPKKEPVNSDVQES